MSALSLEPVDCAMSRPLIATLGAAFCCLAGQACLAAEPSALERAQRISVWGTPVAAPADAAARPDGPAHSSLVQGFAVEQARWGDSAVRGAAVQQVAAGARSGAAAVAPRVEITDISYRWGVADGRNAVDVGVGAGAYRLQTGPDAGGAQLSPQAAGAMLEGRRDAVVPTFSIGLRHRLSDLHRIDLSASGTASLPSPAVGEFYTAKVNVEWLPTRNSGFGFEQSAVNLKFGANSNFALRVRGRGPMIYYRSKF